MEAHEDTTLLKRRRGSPGVKKEKRYSTNNLPDCCSCGANASKNPELRLPSTYAESTPTVENIKKDEKLFLMRRDIFTSSPSKLRVLHHNIEKNKRVPPTARSSAETLPASCNKATPQGVHARGEKCMILRNTCKLNREHPSK